jgi:HSP20 family protein
MAIIKWDPLGNIATLQDRINRIFDDSFPHQANDATATSLCAWTPDVDIYETERGIIIAADLPGVSKEAVQVEVKDNILTLSGERPADLETPATHYYRRERSCGSFHRAFTLRAVVSPEQIKARFKNGVLMVEIPSPEEDAPKKIAVDVE